MTVKPYTFELKPAPEHRVENARGKKGWERNTSVMEGLSRVSSGLHLEMGSYSQACERRLQGADLAFRTKQLSRGFACKMMLLGANYN